jgi:LuxR family maltose regulon positive regulatory protein
MAHRHSLAGALRQLPTGLRNLGIPRESLVQKCLETAPGSVVLLEAPAGFGKTHVLAQWAQEALRRRQTVAWIRLNPADADASHLCARLLETLRGRRLKHAQADPSAPPSGDDTEPTRLVATLVRCIAGHRRRVLLVLDDYHVLENGTAIELLRSLLEHVPANLLVALAGRRTCPIGLSRMLLQGRLHRIDKRALLFSKAEARAFFGNELSPAQLNRLYLATEGWPAALRVAQFCMPEWQDRQADLPSVPEFSLRMDEYCRSEVLRCADLEALDFLTDCAITETLEPDLCDVIRGRTDSSHILAALAANETFMEPVDVEAHSWRIPQPLRRALLRRAVERGSSWLATANQRAAEHFEATGRTREALVHYVEGRNPAGAAQALERAAPFVMLATQGDRDVQALLDLIPVDQLKSFPRLALCRTYLDYKRGLLDEARSTWEELARRTEGFTVDRPGGNDAQLRIESLCVDLLMQFYRQSRAPLEQMRRIETLLVAVNRTDTRLLSFPHLVLAVMYKARGDLEAAESHLIQSEKVNEREAAPWGTLWLKYHYGSVALARGQLIQAKYLLHAGLAAWRTGFRSYLTYEAVSQFALAEIDYEQDALAEARAKLDQGLYTAQHVEGWFEPYAALYETSMMVHWNMGRLDEVESLLVRGLAVQRVETLLGAFLQTLRLRLEVLRGRADAAQAIVAENKLDERWAAPTFQDDFTYREWDLAGWCLALLAVQRGDLEAADSVVERLAAVARRAGRGRTVTRADVLLAVIAHRRGDIPQALAHIQRALEAAHAQGYRRMFLDEGQLTHPVLQAAVASGTAMPAHLATLARSLCNALSKLDKNGAVENGSPLSEREHDVLHELSIGHSNKLIARKLGLSAPTVKFHVRNVFRKLGVHKRASAVAEAHRRGWLA